MKLTTDQIKHIKSRIEKKGFKYLDVQAEIIDHMASSIEDKITENKSLTLDEAYDLTYSELGIFAFSNFEESITKKLKNQLYDAFLRSLRTVLSSLLILIPIAVSSAGYFVQKFSPENLLNLCYAITISSFVLLGIAWWIIYRKNKFLRNYLSFRISIGMQFSISYIVIHLLAYGGAFLNGYLLILILFIFSTTQIALFYGAEAIINKTMRFDQLLSEVSP